MKGFFKFTTAALALVALASCSNDDFLGGDNNIAQNEKGALTVEVEELIDNVTTRAAFVPDGAKNALYWQDNRKSGYADCIEVFDDAMVKYDIYEFNAKKGSFVNIDEDDVKRVSEPKYALFGGGDIAGTYNPCYITGFGWDYATDATTVKYKLEKTYTFAEDTKVAGSGTVAYQSWVPMWGEASKDGESVKVNMHYMTAVLRVYLKNAKSNIKKFRVRAFKEQACETDLPINGFCEATIATSEGSNEKATLVYVGTGTNTIEVDGIENASGDAYLYIPLFAQYYGALKFEYSTDGTNWNLIKTTKPMTLERQKVYRLSLENIKVAGDCLESINAVLEGQKDATADVNITTEQVTTVTAVDEVLKIPAGMTSNITLNLQGLKGSKPLQIESVDGKYAGTLIIDASAAGAASTLANVFINLPKANVVFVGKFTATDFGQKDGTTIVDDKLIVNSLTFSDPEEVGGFGAKDIWVNKESTDFIEVGKGTTVGKIGLQPGQEGKPGVSEVIINGTSGIISAAGNDKVQATITVGADGTAGDIEANGDVTIEGAAGNITTAGKLTFTSETPYTGTVNAKELALGGKVDFTGATVAAVDAFTMEGTAKAGAVTINAKGTATINVDAQDGACDAVATLTVGKNAAITLTQGYIASIDNSACTADDPCTLTFGEGYTAIGNVSSWAIKPTNASKWNGKALPAAAAATYCAGDVWTACQLATADKYTANIRLMNDIDLDNEAWTMPALSYNLVGVDMKNYALGLEESKYPTIKNLTVTAADDKGTGLFKTAHASIYNFTIDGATITSDKSNVGVIAGKTAGTVNIANVTVKNASVAATGKSDNIGGLIGDAGHTVNIGFTGQPVNVSLTKLQGQYNLGGLIGKVSAGTTSINVTKTEITAIEVNGALKTIPSVGTPANDKAGSVGMYIGLIDKVGTPTVNIDAANKGTDYIKGHRKDLGFQANFVDNTHVYYGMKGGEVGICLWNLYIGGVAQMGGGKKDNVAAIGANLIDVYVKVGAADYE